MQRFRCAPIFDAASLTYSGHMDVRAKLAPDLTDCDVTRVFLVEDSAVVRERLLEILKAIPTVEVIGYAETPSDAIEQINVNPPDVIVLDIQLRDGRGMNVLQAIKRRFPAIVVIMLTNYATPAFRQSYLAAGADYFLDKTNEFQNIASILQQLNRNDT